MTDFDEGTGRLVIGDLIERELITVTRYQKLKLTEEGIEAVNEESHAQK